MAVKVFGKFKDLYFIFTIWLSISTSFCVMAQNNFSVTVYGMPQLTSMHGPSQEEKAAIISQTYFPEESREIKKSFSFNFAMGVLFRKNISTRTLIGWGMQYAPAEQKFNTFYKVRGENIKSSIRLKYLKLPVFMQYNYLVREKRKLFFVTGPQLNVLLGENGELPVYGSNGNVPVFDLINPGGAYRNFVLGGFFAAGVQFDPDEKVGIIFTGYIDATFSSVERKSFIHLDGYVNDAFDNNNVTIRTNHQIAIGIMMGFVFKVKNTLTN